jgi:hypothetical protein
MRELLQLLSVHDHPVRVKVRRESVPMVGLHVVLRTSGERVVGADDHACRLGDVLLRGDGPDVGDLGFAPTTVAEAGEEDGPAEHRSPAAIGQENYPTTIIEDGFKSRCDGDASSVRMIANICEGQQTNHVGHPVILASWCEGCAVSQRYEDLES